MLAKPQQIFETLEFPPLFVERCQFVWWPRAGAFATTCGART